MVVNKNNNNIILQEYLGKAIKNIFNLVLKASFKNPKETAFVLKAALKSKQANKIRLSYENKSIHIPPFLIASISSSCNLFCKGCYARANKICGENLQKTQLSCEKWNDVFKEANNIGISFIFLAGGEPFMRSDVLEAAAQHKELIFPVFTNGTMFDEKYYNLFDKNRHLIPVISIEGNKAETDEKRGEGTYDSILNSINILNEKGILYGVSVTVSKTNIKSVLDDFFIESLYKKGCSIVFYVEYVPVDHASVNIAPDEDDRVYLENRQKLLRDIYKTLLFISFPGDEKDMGGCLAAGRGFFHINPNSDAEPCPFSPYSDTNLNNCSLIEALKSPLFNNIRNTDMLLNEHKGGCLLFEKENEIKELSNALNK